MIILSFLKWIFLIILFLILLILLIICWILLSQITFRIHFKGETKNSFSVSVKGHYLTGLILYYFDFQKGQGINFFLKILGKKIFTSEKEIEEAQKSNFKAFDQEDSSPIISKKEQDISITMSQIKENVETENLLNSNKEDINNRPKIVKEKNGEKNQRFNRTDTARKEKKSIKGKITAFLNKINSIKQKIVKIKQDLDYIQLREVLSDLLYFLQFIKPSICFKQLQGYLKYGLEDPSQTGYLTALLYYFLPIEKKYHLSLDPNFEEKELNGEVLITGYIRLVRIVVGVIILFFKKSTQRIIKVIRRK